LGARRFAASKNPNSPLRNASAQAYPSRPVRIIVPFAPGGTFDIMARLIGQWLTEKLGQPFVIENRPGAGGNIGTEAVVRAPADGYALLLVGTANAISVTLYEKLNFNFIRDIVPVAGIARVPEVMLVNPSLPATTVRELIAYAKANAGKLTMASGGIGTLSHLASPSSALFRRERDRGEPPMLNASVRPQPTAVAAVSALAATAGKTSSDEILVNRSPLAANQRCRLCSLGIGPTSTAGFFGSSAMRRLPRTS
jgi:hypothetical protein